MRILVTGSDGFIGAIVCRRLKEKGFEVVPHTIAISDISVSMPEYTMIDWVLHLAALTSITDSWKKPESFYAVNFMGTQRVLEICRNNKCGLTFMSTYVYGHPQYLPVDEKHPIKPNSPYSQSKYLAEQLCGFYNLNYGTPFVILRPFNIYGPGQSKGFLVPSIIAQVLDKTKDEICIENIRPMRDYVYVDDVVDAIIATIGKKNNGIYNVGTGIATSVRELIDIIFAAAGVRKEIKSLDKVRVDEVLEISSATGKINGELNWMSKTTLTEGIKKTYLESGKV